MERWRDKETERERERKRERERERVGGGKTETGKGVVCPLLSSHSQVLKHFLGLLCVKHKMQQK